MDLHPKDAAGSYDFTGLSSPEAELERLRKQAAIAWNIEKTVLLRAGLKPGMRVLDLACGPGFISRQIAGMVAPGGSVTGVDRSEKLLAVARRECREIENVRFIQGDVTHLDLPPAGFDFVYARFLFQHLVHPGQTLARTRPLLVNGGQAVLVDADDGLLGMHPAPEHFESFNTTANQWQRRAGGDREVGRKLGAYLKQAGFAGIAVNVVTLTSEQVPARVLLDLGIGFKAELFPSEQRTEARKTLQKIYTEVLSRETFVISGVYVASGCNGGA